MGDVDGACKKHRGGMKMVPKEVPVFELENLDGLVNIYKDFEK